MKLKYLVKKGLKFISKHDRAILTGINIAASAAAVALAWNARPKC